MSISGLASYAYNAEKVGFMKDINIESDTEYAVMTVLSERLTYIYKRESGLWAQLNAFACSVGKPSTPTITGVFKAGFKSAFMGRRSYSVKWVTQIKGNYLYHSVLYNPSGNVVTDGRIGAAISHGCVRLSTVNAKWIFDNVPRGSTIIIR